MTLLNKIIQVSGGRSLSTVLCVLYPMSSLPPSPFMPRALLRPLHPLTPSDHHTVVHVRDFSSNVYVEGQMPEHSQEQY